MDNPQILSAKPSIDEAIKFLGLSGMDKAMAIQTLLRLSEHDDLPLFFDQLLTCVPTSIKHGDQYDDKYEFVETLFIDSEDEREFWAGHILDSFQLWIPSENTYELVVSQIIRDGDQYYISQSDGTISEGVSIGYEKFYFNREQLIDFKADYHAHFSTSQNGKKTPSKGVSVIDERVVAFKYWLVGNSGRSIHNLDDLKSCYEDMKYPIKDQVWKQLKKMDHILFSGKGSDSMKAIAKVIDFKLGTSTGRDS